MEHRLLRYFVAVAEELSFSRAAKRLYIAPPSLGQQIRQLEAYIGAPLLVRDGHHLQLTEAGQTFLREARIILGYTDRAVELTRQAAKAEAGLMTIAMVAGPEGKLFSTVFTTLFRHYPGIQVILRTLTGPEQLAAIKKREINVGFLRGPLAPDDDIVSEVMVREKMNVLLPGDHPLARQKRIKVSKLAQTMQLIDISPAINPQLHEAIHKVATDAGCRFHTILEAESITATLNAIASGLGFTLHGDYVKHILPKNVCMRPLDLSPVPELELVVIYRKDDRLPAVGFFVDLLRKVQVTFPES